MGSRTDSTSPSRLTKEVLSLLQRLAPRRASLRPVMGDTNRDILVLPIREDLPPALVQPTAPDDYIRPLGCTREDQSVLNGQAWLKRLLVMGRGAQSEEAKLGGVVNIPHFDWSRAGPPVKKRKEKKDQGEEFMRPTIPVAKLVLMRDAFAREGLSMDDYFEGQGEGRRGRREERGDDEALLQPDGQDES